MKEYQYLGKRAIIHLEKHLVKPKKGSCILSPGGKITIDGNYEFYDCNEKFKYINKKKFKETTNG